MPLNFNGKTPEVITFNGKDVLHLVYNGVEVWTKDVSSETWLLKSDLSSSLTSEKQVDISFKSDGVIFNTLKVVKSGAEFILKYDDLNVYSSATNTWASENYKTIIFENKPLGETRVWLLNLGNPA